MPLDTIVNFLIWASWVNLNYYAYYINNFRRLERNIAVTIACVPTIRPMFGVLSRLTRKRGSTPQENIDCNVNDLEMDVVLQHKHQSSVRQHACDPNVEPMVPPQQTRVEIKYYDQSSEEKGIKVVSTEV